MPRERERLAALLRQPPDVTVATAPAPPLLLVSIRPHYARVILDGVKRVEFRRRVPRGIGRARLVGYVTTPEQVIGFSAAVTYVHRGAPRHLWERFALVAGVTRAEFDAYFDGAAQGAALELEDVRPLASPLRLRDRRLRAVGFAPPQSMTVVDEASALGRLIVAHL